MTPLKELNMTPKTGFIEVQDGVTPGQIFDKMTFFSRVISLIRKAKLKDETLQESLRLLEQKLAETHRKRFDEANLEYQGY